jgi:hypothetical protein
MDELSGESQGPWTTFDTVALLIAMGFLVLLMWLWSIGHGPTPWAP